MDINEAQAYLRDHSHSVLATFRGDGGVQLSPVDATVDGEGGVVISSRETAYKVRNIRRDPRVFLCVMQDAFFGDWIQVEGRAQIISLPEAMERLVDYYRRVGGEHPDWDDYRRAMEHDRRVIIRFEIERAGPNVAG